MALLAPDVVKLDMSLLRQEPDAHVAQVVSSVNALAERTGALVLAEGIETLAQVDTARSMGARLGQGYLLGRPDDDLVAGPTSDLVARQVRSSRASSASRRTGRPVPVTPADLLPALSTRRAPKRLLVELSKHLEREALRIGSTAVIVSAFQRGANLTPATTRRYRALAESAGFTCLLGEDLTANAVQGASTVDLDAEDPLTGEWTVVVVSPHFTAALIAVDLRSDTADADRLFEYAVTYDRDVVTRAAHSLLARARVGDTVALPHQRPPRG